MNRTLTAVGLILALALLAGEASADLRVEALNLALTDGVKVVGEYNANPFEGRFGDTLNHANGAFAAAYDFRSDDQVGDFQISKADLSNGADLTLRLQITSDQAFRFDLSGDFQSWTTARDASPYGMVNFANVSQDLMRDGALHTGGQLDAGTYDLVFQLRSTAGSGIGGSNFALRVQVIPVTSPAVLAMLGLGLIALIRPRRTL